MMIETAKTTNTSYGSGVPLSEEKIAEIEKKIDRLRGIILKSDHPEDQHQAIAILNFQVKRFSPALKAVEEAESCIKGPPTRIYLCILERAKYYASINLYSKAKEDLEKINGLTGVTQNKQWEITNIYSEVMENLTPNLGGIHEKNASMGIPIMTFASNCGDTEKNFAKKRIAYQRMESEMQELEEDKELSAEKLKERFRGDEEALVDHIVEKGGNDGPSLYNLACSLAKKGAIAIHNGNQGEGERALTKAKELFDKVIKINENSKVNPDLWYFRALIHSELEDFESALVDIDHAIELSPEQKYISFKECIKKEL